MDILKNTRLRDEVLKHLGPENHPSGSSQKIHGQRGENQPRAIRQEVYHGTSLKAALKIKREGLRIEKAMFYDLGNPDVSIWVTTKHNIAFDYGYKEAYDERAGKHKKFAIVVLKPGIKGLKAWRGAFEVFKSIPPEMIDRIEVYDRADPKTTYRSKPIRIIKAQALYAVVMLGDGEDYQVLGAPVEKHMGPGQHPSGSPQAVHNPHPTGFGGGAEAAAQVSIDPSGSLSYVTDGGYAEETSSGSGRFSGSDTSGDSFANVDKAEALRLIGAAPDMPDLSGNVLLTPVPKPTRQKSSFVPVGPKVIAKPPAPVVVGSQAAQRKQAVQWSNNQRLTPSEAMDGVTRIKTRVLAARAHSIWGDNDQLGQWYLTKYGKNIKPKKLVMLAQAAALHNLPGLASFFADQAYQMTGGAAIKSMGDTDWLTSVLRVREGEW